MAAERCAARPVRSSRDTCVWAGVDKTLRAGFCSGVEKSPKMAQNPHHPLHALLAAVFVRLTKL